jgi:DNA-binding NarL/FixJ family response regulator
LLQDWLKAELGPGYVIEAIHSPEVIERAASLMPQVIIVDVDVPFVNGAPQVDGYDIVQCVKAATPGVHLVVLSLYDDQPHHANAVQVGASVYVPKSRLQSKLVPALKTLFARCGT